MRRLRPMSILEPDLASVEVWKATYSQMPSWRQLRPTYSGPLTRPRSERAAVAVFTLPVLSASLAHVRPLSAAPSKQLVSTKWLDIFPQKVRYTESLLQVG